MGVNHCRAAVATSKLCMVVLVHKCFCLESMAVGSSIIVGRMIFNIVVCLSCGGSLIRGFGWRLLILRGPLQLHRQRMLI